MLYVIVNICGVSNNLINEYEIKMKCQPMGKMPLHECCRIGAVN